MNTHNEEKYYNALNIACFGNYEDLKGHFYESKSWQEAWLKTKKPVHLDPDTQWEKLAKNDIKLILASNPDFPSQLKEIPWPPFALYTKGSFPSREDKLVAIVGTRKATLEGKRIAKKFARKLAEVGLTVVSGLAFGIDAGAHEGVIEAGGKTLAVLANGLDRVYPRHHEALAEKILNLHGSLISEYPIGAPSLPQRFIERNRIISGLTLGIILIEAPENSGALATARFALEQNREVFVVPGSIDNPNFIGSHKLIKDGAALITSIDDVISSLNLESFMNQAQRQNQALKLLELDESQKAVINALKAYGEKAGVDKIAELARRDIGSIASALSFLLIKGMIKEENGKYYL